MSLKLSLHEAGQIKHLKGAIQSIGRIGHELLLEAIPERLILRGINSSKSAYMSVSFQCNFFDSYSVFDTNVVQAGIHIKSVMAVFRSQKIRSLDMELIYSDNTIKFTVICGNGLRKVFRVQCLDAEILQASVDKDQFPVTVVAETGEMNKLLSTFSSTLDEIIIACNVDGGKSASRAVQIHSFFDPAKGNTDKALRTQLAVDTHQVFMKYSNSLGEATDVTFNLKDLKSMVQLCEAMQANMILRFDQPGAPLVVEPHFNHPGIAEELQYEAELVLATLMESQAEFLKQEAGRLATPRPGGAIPAAMRAPLMTPARLGGFQHTPGGLSIPGDTPAPGLKPSQGGGFVTPQVNRPVTLTSNRSWPQDSVPPLQAHQQPGHQEIPAPPQHEEHFHQPPAGIAENARMGMLGGTEAHAANINYGVSTAAPSDHCQHGCQSITGQYEVSLAPYQSPNTCSRGVQPQSAGGNGTNERLQSDWCVDAHTRNISKSDAGREHVLPSSVDIDQPARQGFVDDDDDEDDDEDDEGIPSTPPEKRSRNEGVEDLQAIGNIFVP